MKLAAGPEFPETNPQKYTAYRNIHSNRSRTETLINAAIQLATATLPLNTGFGYKYSNVESGAPRHRDDFKVKTVGPQPIFDQVIQEVRANDVARGANMERNYGPYSVGRQPYVTQNFSYDPNHVVPNYYLLERFFDYAMPSYPFGTTITFHLRCLKISTLNANIRTNTPFPDHPQTIPFPTADKLLFLDMSAWHTMSSAQKDAVARHLFALCPHRDGSTAKYVFVVDMADGVEMDHTVSLTTSPALGWHTGAGAGPIARILDDTLTRQDIRFGLFLSSRPLPRFLDSSVDIVANATGATKTKLSVGVPLPDNREVYLKWLQKQNYDHNEYTISGMYNDTDFAMSLIRDIRICRTFLYQVAGYILEIDLLPDSDPLTEASDIDQMLSMNIRGLDDLFTATLGDNVTYGSKWLAWVPYELAHSTNPAVKLDSPNWVPSQEGRKIADRVQRPSSLYIEPQSTQSETYYYNENDKNVINNPQLVTNSLSNTNSLTLKALPVSMYYCVAKCPIFSTAFAKDDLYEDINLDGVRSFPTKKERATWN